MKLELKKLWPLAGAVWMGFFSSAFAHDYAQSQQSSGQSQQPRVSREITPDAGPRVTNGVDVFLTADFIYWKAVQEGTEYAISGLRDGATIPNPFDPAPKSSVKKVGEDWAPGFKVGLGLNLWHDGWDLYAQYTWLRPCNTSNTSSQFVLAQDFANPGVFGPFLAGTSARASWDLDFNVIDLELGRNFYLSQFLTMRPFIGLKGTWQDNRYNVRVDADDFRVQSGPPATLTNVTGPYKIRNHNDVWGIGARGGLNVAWFMSKNWSIYGDLAWTALWADYYNRIRKDTLDDSTTATSTTVLNIQPDDHYSVRFVGELELGLRWGMWFSDDSYYFAIQAGWEEQVWIKWGHVIETFDENWHNLNFHGLNLKFRFDF